MLRQILIAGAAVLALHAGNAAAQQRVSIPAAADAPSLGFSYGWDGGISVGPDGKVYMENYPTVKAVQPGSPAETAGLRAGDTIIAANDADARQPAPLRDAKGGTKLVLRVRRGDSERELSFLPVPRK